MGDKLWLVEKGGSYMDMGTIEGIKGIKHFIGEYIQRRNRVSSWNV
jgi:hypothetical protein